jgi:hypothetical protein
MNWLNKLGSGSDLYAKFVLKIAVLGHIKFGVSPSLYGISRQMELLFLF